MEIKLSELDKEVLLTKPIIQTFEYRELKGTRVDLLWETPNSFIEAYVVKDLVFIPTEFHPLYLLVGKLGILQFEEMDQRFKGRTIEIELCPGEFESKIGRLPKNQEEFDEWCNLVRKGLFNGHIDWDILYDCASEGFIGKKGEK